MITTESPSWPARRRLLCPDCDSESLKVKPLKGWELLIVLLCDLRNYGCNDCGIWFRAKDRRRYPREENPLQSPWAAGLSAGRWSNSGSYHAWALLSNIDQTRKPGSLGG